MDAGQGGVFAYLRIAKSGLVAAIAPSENRRPTPHSKLLGSAPHRYGDGRQRCVSFPGGPNQDEIEDAGEDARTGTPPAPNTNPAPVGQRFRRSSIFVPARTCSITPWATTGAYGPMGVLDPRRRQHEDRRRPVVSTPLIDGYVPRPLDAEPAVAYFPPVQKPIFSFRYPHKNDKRTRHPTPTSFFFRTRMHGHRRSKPGLEKNLSFRIPPHSPLWTQE